MPAAKKIRLNSGAKLGIVAGGGALPSLVARSALNNGLDVHVFALEGQADIKSLSSYNTTVERIGAAGKILRALQQRDIKDIVLIGSVRRPSMAELKPDATTMMFFARYGKKAMGDDGVLKALRAFLEDKGFVLHGAQEFVAQTVAISGLLTKTKPQVNDINDVERGIAVLNCLAPLDIGQAVLVQQGLVLGIEAIEGTAELIKRCAHLKRDGGGGVLVKFPKEGQDKDLDMPTIGPDTISSLASAGFAGIVVKADSTFIIDPEEVVRLADAHSIFVDVRS